MQQRASILPFVVLLLSLASACSSAHESGADGSTLPDGATVLPDGAVLLPDGGTTGHDGGVIVLPDGGLVFPDGGGDGDGGIVVGPDGGIVILPDGGIVLPDGAVVSPDGGVVVLPDGGTVPPAHVGTPCHTDADCPGLFCSPASSGFGYCSWLCGPTMPCPGDAVCAYFMSSTSYGYCMQRCDPGAPSCSMGTLCEPGIADAPVCYPGCTTDSDCPTGDRCGSGVTGVRSCYAPMSAVGDPCTASSDCPDSGYCLDEASWGTPHGLCITFCTLPGGAGCGAGTTCVAWGFTSGYGSCVPTCDDTHPCRTGYACVPTPDGTTNACVIRCTSDSDCSSGHACNFVTGRCG